MKKFISLFIVSVLILSLIPCTFSYAKDLSYDEMSELLNAMDILHGDGTGYNYEGILTRAQFTKLAIASSSYKNSVPIATNTSPFSDVKYTHWAAGYIKVATTNSIIMGYPDSTFRPEGYVKTEEAVTILLKMLGYTNEDFGGEWPYGQMGIAGNIGLLDDVSAKMGENLKRIDAIAMIYNMLGLNTKEGAVYLTKLGYNRIDDAVIYASSKEDTTIDANKVQTSAGLFKVGSSFDFKNVGRCGDIIVKTANNEIISFFPINQGLKTYKVSLVQGEDIWLSDGGTSKLLSAQSNTTVYDKSEKTTYAQISSQIEEGDEITVITNEQGYISYMLAKLSENSTFENTLSETYVVSTTLGTNIIVNDKGGNKALVIPSDTDAYYDSSKTEYSVLASKVTPGDIITVVKDSKGEVRYVSVDTNQLQGPYTVGTASVFNAYGIPSDATVLKGGTRVSEGDIKTNDIIYFSSTLNTVWVYSDRKTGIYESASPNSDIPTSVTLSGTSYNIESPAAFTKLSSGGSFSYGQTITLLLGRNGEIADVISPSTTDTVYGYVISAGKGTYENASGSTYSSYNVKIATPDGYTYEYITKKDYSGYVSNVCKVTFENSAAVLSLYENEENLSGTFDANKLRLGNSHVSRNVNIIDVKKKIINRDGDFIRTYASRLDGINIYNSQILYSHKNASGEIDELILQDVTGDVYSYGIVVSNNLSGGNTMINSSGSYIINGITSNFSGGFTVKAGTCAKFDIVSGSVEAIEPLSAVEGKISKISDTVLTTAEGETYYMSDKVSIYTHTASTGYMLTTPEALMEEIDKYSVRAYFDKSPATGGRIRIITAKK